ncbi:hypothetical protein [Actomonas aquatica]|uniref:ABC transporter permease n=1 Tax=Actomonas aquatica TaxID=2866162 RepID=A0ABZ1C6S0_9BACT|nr:hypothetical protein [Opitutus sp. WL0086]WRQ87037.1 hypothetical protein K1X11_019660 [Opitutus sp. WL0086]
MNLRPCLLLLRKDLVRLAVLVVPALLLMWADRFVAFGTLQPSRTFNDFGVWTTVLQWPLIVLVGMALGNEDRAIGDQTFWRTRPIPPGQVLLAKLLALGLTLVLPASVFEFIRALQHDLPASLAAVIAVERFATVGLISSIALLLGAASPSILRAIIAVVVMVVAVLLFLLADQQFQWVKAVKALRLVEVSAGSRQVVSVVIWGLATLGLLHQLYRRANARLVLFGGPLALIGGLLIGQWWFVQVVAEPHDAPPTNPVDPADLPALRLRNAHEFGVIQRTSGPTPSIRLGVPAQLDTSTDSFAAEILFAESELTFPDGTTYNTRWSNPYFPLPLQTARKALQQEVGLRAHRTYLGDARADHYRPNFQIGQVPQPTIQPWQGRDADLTSKVRVRYSRLRLATTLPLERGASWAEAGVRLQVLGRPQWQHDRIELPILQSRATSLLHPTGALRPDQRLLDRFFGFALINRTTQEAALAVQFGYQNSSELGATFEQRILRPRFADAEGMADDTFSITSATIDEQWLEQAELVIFVSDHVGEVDQTLDFGPITLPTFDRPLPDGSFLHD